MADQGHIFPVDSYHFIRLELVYFFEIWIQNSGGLLN